ncbi:MAG: hypothetical protein HY735_37010 [Verrucomicrobia bacterium]|nr:hypothetical protein [Verrucomicrobiota bacterium]
MKTSSSRFRPAFLPTAALLLRLSCAHAAESPPGTPAPASLPIAEVKRTQSVDFQTEVLPILKNNCLACHNQTKAKAELILETPQTILKGGESGPAVVPGRSAESLLLKAAAHQTETVMPPRDNKVNASDLTPEQLGLIKLWIDQGAKGEVRTAAPVAWKPLPDGVHPILAVTVTTDGQFAACGRGNQIYIYHLPSKRLVTRLTDPQLIQSGLYRESGVAHRDMVHSLAFSPDGDLLASGDYRQAKLWRRPKDVQTFSLPGAEGRGVRALAISPDGKWLALAREDKNIKLVALTPDRDSKLLSGHEKAVTSVQFSLDGAKLVSGSEDRTIRVWDVREGEVFAHGISPAEVRSAVWLADGKQIASGDGDHLIRIWQLSEQPKSDLIVVKELKGHDGPVNSLARVGVTGAEILSGSSDGSLKVWDLQSAKVIREMKHGSEVIAVAARNDGGRFASAGACAAAKLWDAHNGQLIAELKGDRYAYEAAAAAERELAFAAGEITYRKSSMQKAETEHKVQLERVKKATEARQSAAKAVAEKQEQLKKATETKSAAEKALAELNEEMKKVTDEYQAAEKAAQKASSDAKAALAKILPAKKPADGAAEPQSLSEKVSSIEKALEAATAKAFALGQLKPRFDQVTSGAPDRKKQAEEKIASSTKAVTEAEKEFKKAEIANSTAENEFQLATKAEKQASDAVASSRSALALAEETHTQMEMELKKAKDAAAQSEKPIRTIAFSPDNLTVATAGDDPMVHTWSADNGAPFESLKGHKTTIAAVTFTRDGGLVSGGTEPAVVVWDLNPDWKLERLLGTADASSAISDRVNAVRFSPDGRRLATGSGEPTRGGEIKIWDVNGGQLVHDLRDVHSDVVFSLDFNPDGKYLASGAADKFVRVVALATGKVVKSFEGHTHHVLGVSWKREGRTLASAGADNVIKIWDFVTGERKKNIDGFNKEVTAASFIGITDQVVATSGDSQVRIVKENGDKVRSFDGVTDFMYAVAATPDGKTIVAGGQDGVLRVWNGSDGKVLAAFESGTGNTKLADAGK